MIGHDPWLVLLSVLMAVQGAYVAFVLTRSIVLPNGMIARGQLAGSALSMATGIWSMHFVGMLAADLPSNTDFLALPTLLSYLLCALVVGIGISVMTIAARLSIRLGLGGSTMGLGVTAMHYIGMMALHTDGRHIGHETWSVVLSIFISVGGSIFALWLIDFGRHRPMKRLAALLPAALAFGCAVAGMHYVAMAGMSLHVEAQVLPSIEPSLSRGNLALIVAVVAFIVSGGFFILLIPQKSRTASVSIAAMEVGIPEPAPERLQSKSSGAIDTANRPLSPALTLPVMLDGQMRQLPIDHIQLVRANAHYTYLFDGKSEHFCQLSISQLEARLGPDQFLRVHRSYMVNLLHATRVRRRGDEGLIELRDQKEIRVPVSRAKLAIVKKRLASLSSET